MKAQTALSPISLQPTSIQEFWRDIDKLMEQVRERAYQIFESRGRGDGHDVEDWFKAETELLEPIPLEITEKDNTVVIRAELPGFKKDELQINLEAGVLTIKGEHREEHEKKDEKTYHSEKSSRRIFRRFALPVNVIADQATAALNYGVLELSVPKAEPSKTISIKAA